MSTGGRYREKAGARRAAAVMYDSAAWIGLLSTNGTPPKVTVRWEKNMVRLMGSAKNHGCARDNTKQCERFIIYFSSWQRCRDDLSWREKETEFKTQFQCYLGWVGTNSWIYKALHNVCGKVKVSVTLAWRNDLEQAVRNEKEVGAKTFCYELMPKGNLVYQRCYNVLNTPSCHRGISQGQQFEFGFSFLFFFVTISLQMTLVTDWFETNSQTNTIQVCVWPWLFSITKKKQIYFTSFLSIPVDQCVCVTTIEYHSMGNGNYAVVNEQNSRDDDESRRIECTRGTQNWHKFLGFKLRDLEMASLLLIMNV